MNHPERKLHRLTGYDYSQSGRYFVTICTCSRRNLLCDIVGNDALVVPTPIGEKVIECWKNIERLNKNVSVDKLGLMPNHIHGVIVIADQDAIEVGDRAYGYETVEQASYGERRDRERRGRRSLPGLVKDFKSVTTRIFLKHYNLYGLASLWQASYYDEIIRNEEHYAAVLDYIDQNPLRWAEDKYFST